MVDGIFYVFGARYSIGVLLSTASSPKLVDFGLYNDMIRGCEWDRKFSDGEIGCQHMLSCFWMNRHLGEKLCHA